VCLVDFIMFRSSSCSECVKVVVVAVVVDEIGCEFIESI